jgi:hypothetical protein
LPDAAGTRTRAARGQPGVSAVNLTVQAMGAIIGLIITTLFVVHPTPRLMALFVFVAQPLFLIVGVMYLGRVIQELREKDVL